MRVAADVDGNMYALFDRERVRTWLAAEYEKVIETSLPEPDPIQVVAHRLQSRDRIVAISCSSRGLAVDNLEYMVPAFDTVYGLLNSAAGELETVADACRELGRTVAGKSVGEPFDPGQHQD